MLRTLALIGLGAVLDKALEPAEPSVPAGSGEAPTRTECQSFLQAMYKEQCDQARQHETMRQQATTLVITLTGAVVSIAAASGGILAFIRGSGNNPDVHPLLLVLYSFLGVFVIFLARHGRKLSMKHYERSQFHTERARAYRRRAEELFNSMKYKEDHRQARLDHEAKWREEIGGKGEAIVKQRLYVLWNQMFDFLVWVGVFLVVVPLFAAAGLAIKRYYFGA